MSDLAYKKKLIAIAGIIILVLFWFFAYLIFSSPAKTKKPAAEGIGAKGTAPGAGFPSAPAGIREEINGRGVVSEISGAPAERLLLLADFPVVSPALNKEENRILFYKKDGGHLFSSDFSGGLREKISNLTVVGIIGAQWTKKADRAAVFYLDGEYLKGFLHIGTSGVAVLPQDIKSFSWSPDNSGLAYFLRKGAGAQIITADAGGKNSKISLTLPVLDGKITWVAPDKIAYEPSPSAFARGSLLVFSRSSGQFQKTIGPVAGLSSLWSPDGKYVLVSFSRRSGKELGLAVYDASGKEIFNPGFGTTADKCAWVSSKEIYCGVPKNLPEEAVFPDDYLKGEVVTEDKITVVNIEKKEAEEVLDENGKSVLGENVFSLTDLVITKDKQYLFFVDKTTGYLWSLKLK